MDVDIKGKTLKDECIVLDIETTGFSARNDSILRIDAVIFIYRDEYYNDDSEREGLAELIVAKNNMGAVGTIEIEFDKCFAKFKNRQNLW